MNNEQNNNNNPINFAEGVVITKNTGTITGTITLTSGTFTVTGNIGESRSISSFNIGDITNNHISLFSSLAPDVELNDQTTAVIGDTSE